MSSKTAIAISLVFLGWFLGAVMGFSVMRADLIDCQQEKNYSVGPTHERQETP